MVRRIMLTLRRLQLCRRHQTDGEYLCIMAVVKSAIKAPSVPSLPSFELAPSCAECSDNLRHELQRKDALRLQHKLKKQERERLDFHGLAGDVRGFLAFMTHKYGSFCRGWRKDVATDEMGVANVLQSDFFHAMRKIGYTGQLLTLWKELTHNEKESCWLADLDPKLSRGLDQLASGLWKVYRRGTQQAWEDIPRAWLTRMNFEEFLAWMNEQAIARSRGFAVSERQLFDVLDIKGIGTVTLKEFRFLDYWAHKRLKKPLPPDEVPPEPPTSPKSEPRLDRPQNPDAMNSKRGFSALGRAADLGHVEVAQLLLEASADPDLQSMNGFGHVLAPLQIAARQGHVELLRLLLEARADQDCTRVYFFRSPVAKKSPRKRHVKDFRAYLERLFGGPGGAGRAWRTALDVKGTGAVSVGDFGSGCRAVGWKHDHAEMWKLLKAAGGGVVCLRALDPQTAEALDEFKDEAMMRTRSVHDFWMEDLDPGGVGAVSRTEFLKDAGKALRLPRETLVRVFNVLDTTATGWVSLAEFGYLEAFETKIAEALAEEKAKEGQKARGYPINHAKSVPELASPSRAAKLLLPPGVLGDFRLPWQARENRGEMSPAELACSPLGRQLWAPQRSSRSFQYRALQNSHTLKHRWLATAIEDRSLCTNFDALNIGVNEASPRPANFSFFIFTMRGGTMRIVAAAAYLFGLRPAVAVSELGIHRGLMKLESSLHAGPMTTQDGKTGKPTVDSGEHLDPYDVPAELIGDVGMAGAKGAQGAQGECGDPGLCSRWPLRGPNAPPILKFG
eukprot:s857_g4.t2